MKKIFALILALSMLLVFASCGNKDSGTNDDVSETESITEETITEEAAEEVPEETSEKEDETEAAQAAEDETEKEEESKEDASETEVSEEEEKEEKKAPETKEEILAAYNDAVNSAYSTKAGFSKERYTNNEYYDMSVALKPFKSLVEKFVGIGADNKYSETVTKGKWDSDPKREYLRKSTLTASDINDATCKEDGKYYIITIKIKDGSSVGDKDHRSSTSPIDKCGLCTGNEDKGYYDHKSGPVIYDAIAGTYEGAKINENYKNAVAVAKVDKDTGKLVSLNVDFDITVKIDINIGSGTATGTTHVAYKNFSY